jgi:hypothetical protein
MDDAISAVVTSALSSKLILPAMNVRKCVHIASGNCRNGKGTW